MLFEEREFETPPSIAKAVGCGAEKIRNAILRGELKAHDFGGPGRSTFRITKGDWEAYLELKARVTKAKAKRLARRKVTVAAKNYV